MSLECLATPRIASVVLRHTCVSPHQVKRDKDVTANTKLIACCQYLTLLHSVAVFFQILRKVSLESIHTYLEGQDESARSNTDDVKIE